ncbi:translation initiation factor IF-2 subunit beta [Candidatus Bathyarchaeota archaeon B24-2]|nr:MAG: translation initiation factor IF-2 subunit beta [Candidatus Bathyarchaeota archaeon B24-2]
MIDYWEMLKRARKQLPVEVFKHKRFEVPDPIVSIVGSRTILHNFVEICDHLNRDRQHLLKFLSREMATSGVIEGTRAIFQGNFQHDVVKRLIDRYVQEYVICPICKRPDTRIVKEKRFHFLVCEACGARSSLRPV